MSTERRVGIQKITADSIKDKEKDEGKRKREDRKWRSSEKRRKREWIADYSEF